MRPQRSPTGGSGNGTGGNATIWITETSEGPGGAATAVGVGGAGSNGIFNPNGSINATANGGDGGNVGATDNVTSSVTGGTGGAGEAAATANPQSIVGGGGGGGGTGVFIGQSNNIFTVGAATTLAGGGGGVGGDAQATAGNGNATNGDPGGGGGGGAGVIIGAGAGGVSFINSGRLLGGVGGNGGYGGYAGGGGGGGDGILVLGAGGVVTNNAAGNIVGGVGGNAGMFEDGNGETGGYGGGGAGVNLVGAGASLTNSGTITGGNASTANITPSAQDGTPGVGVRAWGGETVTTSGAIAGGSNGNVQADSVLFSGGGNRLTIEAGASFVGNIVSASGVTNGGDTLSLNGTADGTIDAGQFVGFATYSKDGNSTWTLTGNGASNANWTITSGELIGDTNSLAGNITFNALAGTPTVEFNQTASGTFGGTIDGSGNLTKAGTGTLTLAGDVSGFVGQLMIDQGKVTVTGTGDMHGAEIVGSDMQLDITGTSSGTLSIASISGGGTVEVGSHTLIVNNAANDVFGGTINGSGGLAINGGTQVLTGANNLTGTTTIANGAQLALSNAWSMNTASTTEVDGTLSVLSDGTMGALTVASGGLADLEGHDVSIGSLNGQSGTIQSTGGTGVLTINQGTDGLYVGGILNNGGNVELVKNGSAALTLTGINLVSAVTLNSGLLKADSGLAIGDGSASLTVNGGTLDITNHQDEVTSLSGTGGSIISSQGAGSLTVNQATDTAFDGDIKDGAGSLSLTKNGAGSLTLNGVNSFTGQTTVSGGTLIVGDDTHTGASLTSGVVVENGATLGGHGTVGSTVVASGGTLAPGASLGTLTVDGDLTVSDGSNLDFEFGAPGPNFSTPGQSDHVVVTRNLSIGSSTLNVNNLGGMGPGLYNLFSYGGSLDITGGGIAPPPGMSIQVLTTDKQINLVDTQGLTLNVWDANGQAGPGQMGGGSGTWSVFSNNWADTTGQFVGPMAPQPGFAIFGGEAGTVMVDDRSATVGALGMQFFSDGYHLVGDAIDLVGQNGIAPVIRVSDGATATIDNILNGVDGLNKTDGGTLVLNGANIYTGNTVLSGGELSVSSDANLGDASGALDFEGGTLQVTGSSFDHTGRNIIWGNPGGGFDIADANNNFTVTQDLGGSGVLLKTGAGTLTLSGDNSYSGGTQIRQGTLVAEGGNAIGDQSSVFVLGGTFRVIDDETVATLSGDSGTVELDGADLTLSTSFANVTASFAGSITGSGGLVKEGAYKQVLSGDNSYQGDTQILGGTLYAVGAGIDSIPDASAVTVGAGATLSLVQPSIPFAGEESDDETIGSLAGAGDVELGAQSLTVGGNDRDTTFSGVISGTGALVKMGSGTMTLSGVNTYSGGTEIDGGVLSVSSDDNLGETTGPLVLNGGTLGTTADIASARDVGLAGNGTLLTGAGTTLTLSGLISGPGSLSQTGGGTLVLTGDNTFSGSVIIDNSTLQIGNGGSSGRLGHGDTQMVGDAKLIFDRGDTYTYDGTIAGPGRIEQNGSGATVLAGEASGFTGQAMVSAGILTFKQGFGGDLGVGSAGTATFDQASDDVFSGTVSGAGALTKSGAGILAYDGDGSGFSGTTTVSAGGLIIGSDVAHEDAVLGGSVSVAAGAVLGGHGTVGSGRGSVVTISSGGTVSPGNSPGTLSVDGDYVQAAGSTYAADISPDGTSDLIAVTGTAALQGGTVFAVKAPGGYAAGTSYTILTAAGGVSGVYERLDQNAPFVDLGLSYDSTAVHLDVARNDVDFCDVARTSNECAVAAAAQDLGAGNAVYDAIAGVPTAEEARGAFNQLSGEIHASLKGVLIDDSHFVRDAVNERIRSAFGSVGAQTAPVMAYGAKGKETDGATGAIDAALAPADTLAPTAWSAAFGAWSDFDSNDEAAKVSASTGGFLTGIDAALGQNWRAGVVAGYSHTNFAIDDRNSSGDAQNWHLGIYGGGQWDGVMGGALGLRAGAAYTWHDISTSRSVAFTGYSDRLTGDYDAGTAQAFGEVAYDVKAGKLGLEPFVNVAYVSLHTDGFSEDGGAAALSASSSTTEATFTTLGLRVSTGFSLSGIAATARGTLGWRHAFGDVTPSADLAFTGADAFTVTGAPIGKDAALLEAGLDLAIIPSATLGLSYQGQFASAANQNGFNAKLEVRF